MEDEFEPPGVLEDEAFWGMSGGTVLLLTVAAIIMACAILIAIRLLYVRHQIRMEALVEEFGRPLPRRRHAPLKGRALRRQARQVRKNQART